MPNIQQILNGEIRRLARKEVKAAVTQLLEANANLRNRLTALEKRLKALEKAVPQPVVPEKTEQSSEQQEQKIRFSPARIKKLREKIGVPQWVFAELVQVTVGTVNNWEHGKSKPQSEQKKNLAALRGLGKRELTQKVKAILTAEKKQA